MHRYAPRTTRMLEPLSHEGWRLKRYSIALADEPFDAGRFDGGIALARAELPSPAVTAERLGVGFLILHQGRGVDYTVLGWWDRENELPLRVFVRDANDSPWRPARASESVCVWDLEVINAERNAYVESVLGDNQDGAAEAYLERQAGTESTSRELIRHTIATLAYRGAKALRGAPAAFGEYRVADGSRTPAQILAHMGDLFDWALWLARGEHRWKNSEPADWSSDVSRFFAALTAFDAYIASGAPLHAPAEQLFQGPIADALTHVGQLTMLRRAFGHPVRGENYARATIARGVVSDNQPPSNVEFD